MMFGILTAFVIGYALGSIPFGLLLTRAAGLGDIRKIGSGNIGATNVLRTGNKGLAAATLVLDAAKGFLAVAAASLLPAELIASFGAISDPSATGHFSAATSMVALAGGYGAFVGHCYPVWLGWRGGKGVATFIGILLALDWRVGLVFCALWLTIAVIVRISSLSALSAAVLTPMVTWLVFARPELAIAILPLSALLLWKHRANIARLIAGEEPRIGQRT